MSERLIRALEDLENATQRNCSADDFYTLLGKAKRLARGEPEPAPTVAGMVADDYLDERITRVLAKRERAHVDGIKRKLEADVESMSARVFDSVKARVEAWLHHAQREHGAAVREDAADEARRAARECARAELRELVEGLHDAVERMVDAVRE